MSQEFESDFDDIGRTRSGKKYKVDFSSPVFEDSSDSIRQQSPSTTEEPEGVSLTTLIPYRNRQGLRITP